jgi:hypothetical protein
MIGWIIFLIFLWTLKLNFTTILGYDSELFEQFIRDFEVKDNR